MQQAVHVRHPRATAASPLFACVIATVFGASGASAAATAQPAAPDVSAGAYLAEAAHCSACHTSRADRPFAGNVAMKSKFGTMYSANITPDPKTGIGDWTEADFTNALRQGKGRHGEYLYPSMPYTDFTKISDADVHSLWLYFRTIKPIVEKKKANAMPFPFDVRPGLAAWQAIYFKPGRYVDDKSESAQWNRGAYLVQSLGHCGACHSPRNIAMATKTGHALQGGDTGDWWFAPDISGSRLSGIRDWGEEQIVAYLRSGHNDLNVAAVGPMLQTVAQGTSKLTTDDLQAIATYLKHQAAQKAPAVPSNLAMTAEQRADGGQLYAEHCESCHGSNGEGVPGIAPALAGNTAVSSANAETVVHAALQGFAPQGPWGAMPSFASGLGNQQIADISNYVRNAWGNHSAANATDRVVAHMRLDVDTTNPKIDAALVCPTVPSADSDARTVAEMTVLAKQDNIGARSIPPGLVSDYRRRHPGLAGGDAITRLSGLYCRALMSTGSGSTLDKQTRFIRFSAGVAQQVARKG